MIGRRGSHAPSLVTLVRRALVECGLTAGTTVLVACSGGPDSTALLHALALLREQSGIRVVAHGVDHGLRAEAASELAGVEQLAGALDVPFGVTKVTVVAGGNLQARARGERLDALPAAARAVGATAIATGHTADDRAETVVMRLVRGTGPRGLAVLPPRAGDLVRPLWRATRADVLLHVERHALVTASDPSNANPRFVRTRIRHEIMPLLASLSPRAVQAICALADDMIALELPEPEHAGLTRRQKAEKTRVKKR
jgi:tRNA(Ile)-lysidine synthase